MSWSRQRNTRQLHLGNRTKPKTRRAQDKFGLAGATDSHTSLATAEEENFFGKHSGAEPSPDRMDHPFMAKKDGTVVVPGWGVVAWGAVWATENTREALFDAMQRKEVYATTGSRIAVRFFGGWNYTDDDLKSRSPAFQGYRKGAPMGGWRPGGHRCGEEPVFPRTQFQHRLCRT